MPEFFKRIVFQLIYLISVLIIKLVEVVDTVETDIKLGIVPGFELCFGKIHITYYRAVAGFGVITLITDIKR